MISLSKKLIGNEKLTNKLMKSFYNNNLSNSIILTGQKGIGKCTLAFFLINKIFSSFSLSNHLSDNQSNLIYKDSHPNVKYLTKELDSKTDKIKNFISIDQIRNLNNFFHQSSLDNIPKFIIIDSADDLNINSANALLKNLEEPKTNTFFILISHQPSNLLPTIRSRCSKFNLEMPTIDNFNKILKLYDEHFNLNDLNFIYKFSNSSPGIAIQVNDKNLMSLYSDTLEILLNWKILTSKVINLSKIVGNFSNDDYKAYLMLLRFILLNIVKINLGFNNDNNFFLTSVKDVDLNSFKIQANNYLIILEYLNENENDLFVYNLDKKIFFLNIFSSLDR
jgi:DNA polymerase-3 subunit delta'